jgi:hypothetical protein
VLQEVVAKAPDPRRAVEAAIRRLDEQLDRIRNLYEFGEWDAADGETPARPLASIFDHIEAAADVDNGLQLIGVPNPRWRPFFAYVVAQDHTWSCSNLSEVRERREQLAPLLAT